MLIHIRSYAQNAIMALSTDRHGHKGAPSEATLMKEAMKLAKNKGGFFFLHTGEINANETRGDSPSLP